MRRRSVLLILVFGAIANPNDRIGLSGVPPPLYARQGAESDLLVLDDMSDARTQSIFPNSEPGAPSIWHPAIGYGGVPPIVSGGVLTATIGVDAGSQSKHQLHMRTVDNDGFHFIRLFTEPGGTSRWTNGTYNRMRFQVKQPSGLAGAAGGGHNVELGTFLHNWEPADRPMLPSDVNNWHFYHYFNIPGDDLFWQVIVDTRVNHRRSDNGENGDWEFPSESGENIGKTYFDMMAGWYWDLVSRAAPGTTLQMRPVTLFHEDETAAVAAGAYSLSGTFDPSRNTVKLAWQRPHSDNDAVHDVAWSLTPVTDFRTAAAGGSATASGATGSTSMALQFSSPLLADERYVYVAIRPRGQRHFRTMRIDLTMND